MSVRIELIHTVLTHIPKPKKLTKMKKKLIHLQHLREQGSPDRFGEEDLLRKLDRTPNLPAEFWEKGGYQWAG